MPDFRAQAASPVSEAAKLQQDNSVLGNVARFVSRPGYIARSLLRGDVGGALANEAQMGLDLFTGGWLNRNWSIANLFTETGDITTAEQRPEFSDLLESWGANPPKQGLARFGIDLVGGIVTDPLTYLGGLPGLGRAAALEAVKPALAGARLAVAAEETAIGAAKLPDALQAGLDAFRLGGRPGAPANGARALLNAAEAGGAQITPEWLASGAAEGALGLRRASRLRRVVQAGAGEQIMRGILEQNPTARAAGVRLVNEASVDFFARASKDLAASSDTLPAAVRQALEQRGVRASAGGITREQAFLAFDDAVAAASARNNPAEVSQILSARSAWQGAADDALEQARAAVGVGEHGDFLRLTGHGYQAELVGMGQRFLETNGTLARPGSVYLGIPFTKAQVALEDLPLPVRAGAAALAGPLGVTTFGHGATALPRALYRWSSPNTQRWIDQATGLVRDAAMVLFDRTQVGKVLEGGSELVRQLAGERVGRTWRYASTIARIFDGVDHETATGLGRAMQEEEARLWQLQVDVARRPGVPIPRAQFPNPTMRFPTITDELEREVRALGGDPAALAQEPWGSYLGHDGRMAAFVQRENVVDRVTRERAAAGLAPLSPDHLGAIVDGVQTELAKVRDELERLGIFNDSRLATERGRKLQRLGYVPHQAVWELQGFLSQAPGNTAFRRDLLDAFTRAREHDTIDKFREAMTEIASRYEVPLPQDVVNAITAGPGAQIPAEENLAALLVKRLMSHARTVERWTLVREAESRLKTAANATNMDRYVNAQLEGIRPRENLASKLLGGGKFWFPVRPGPGEDMRAAIARFQARGNEVGLRPVLSPSGERVGSEVQFAKDWPGLNFFFKPALTVLWPSFHVRNVASNLVLGAMNPQIGLAGVGIMARSIRDLPVLRSLTGWAPTDAGLALRALRDPESLTPQLQQRLASLKIGTFSADAVLKVAREGVVGRDFSEAEVMAGIVRGWAQELALSSGEKGLTKLAALLDGKALLSRESGWQRFLALNRKVVRPFAALGSYLEDSQRLGSFMHMVSKGLDPQEALRQVNKTFADYKIQGYTERAIRDLIPFARFSIATAPVTIENVARAPGNPLGFALARPALAAGSNQQQVLPETLQGRPAAPAGFDNQGNPVYATSLGLPFDVAGDALSFVASPLESARRVLGGALTPPVRALGEAVTGTNFFFGDEAGTYRAAPRLPFGLRFPGSTSREVAPGKTVQEIPGWVNHWLLGAMPWARARTEFDGWLDDRKTWFQRFARGLTGVRFQTADQQAAAQRVLEGWLRGAVERGEVGSVEEFFRRGKVSPEVEQALRSLAEIRKRRPSRAQGR